MDAADVGDFVGSNPFSDSKTFYTKIPKQAHPLGSTPQEITKHSLDKSYLLLRLLKKDYNDGKFSNPQKHLKYFFYSLFFLHVIR